jgi:hypothetical protein
MGRGGARGRQVVQVAVDGEMELKQSFFWTRELWLTFFCGTADLPLNYQARLKLALELSKRPNWLLNFELQLNLTQMSKIPLSNSLLDTADVVFLTVRPPVPHPLDLNLSLFSPWRLGFWLGEDSNGRPFCRWRCTLL